MPTTITGIPNPYTPMAWVPPVIAKRLTLQLYAAVGALAVSNLTLKVSPSNPMFRFSHGTFFYTFLKIILCWKRTRSGLTDHLVFTLLQGMRKFCPWHSRYERHKQAIRTSPCAQSRYRPKSVVLTPSKDSLLTKSNFSCTNWQLRLHPSCRFSVHYCFALHLPSPCFPCRRPLQKQQICHRFLRSVLACRSGAIYCCAYGRIGHANRKHSLLRPVKFQAIRDNWCDYSCCPWHIDFRGDDIGFCEELVHGNQYEKFL